MSPCTASPCISPPCTSTAHEYQNVSTKGLRASPDSNDSSSIVQTAAAVSYDGNSAQTLSRRRNTHSRRTRKAKRDPSRLHSASSSHSSKSTDEPGTGPDTASAAPSVPSVEVTQSEPTSNLMSGRHLRNRQLPLPPLIPPRSPIRRRLPPKPQLVPSAPPVLPRHDHSLPSPRDSGVAGLIGLVDEMIIDAKTRLVDHAASITAH
jgi:hypothetical protein